MKFSDIQSKSQAELNEMLNELQVKLGKLRFELTDKSLKDTSQLGKTRKDIARVLTATNMDSNQITNS